MSNLPIMIYGLIPAAGKSARMGRPKLALPVGDKSVVEQVVHALQQGGVDHVLVVLGPHPFELARLAESAGAETLLLPTETRNMRATVEEGLRWLENHFQPREEDYWLLIPGDHPTLDGAVVRQLIHEQRTNPEYSIFIPTYQGHRGHPALIAWKHVKGLRQLSLEVGINVYLRQQVKATLNVPVENAEILFDLDTPEDYQRLRTKWISKDE
jgi:molybdenum cofactor cytidylyltransferase